MSTLSPAAPRPRRARRRGLALAVPLLAAGALAAGCGAAQSSGTAGAPPHATGPAKSAAPVPTTSTAPTATPVPTVSGGHVAAGAVACVGWPADTTSAALPVSFVPVTVERCVNGAQTVPGKGLWTTATLQRATGDLTALISALRAPATPRQPGTFCPAVAVVPPQVVLINASGQKLIPRLPVTGCDMTSSKVLAALDALRWQPVSVRLIAQIQG
jgi:hypothetical protein